MPPNTAQSPIHIRPYHPKDHLPQITAMLHRAYKPLAQQGMRYLASHQDQATTHDRLTTNAAQALVAVHNNHIVGTITLYHPDPDSQAPWYARSDVMCFGQFAVDPAHQGTGLGSKLLNAIETHARSHGAAHLACDTSQHATDLIAMYQRRAYQIVAHTNWDLTNYQSVILSLPLQ